LVIGPSISRQRDISSQHIIGKLQQNEKIVGVISKQFSIRSADQNYRHHKHPFFFYQNLSLGQRADQSWAVRLKKLATSITFYIFSENNLHECTFRRHTTQANSKFFARMARLTPKGEAESAQIETYSNVFVIFCSGELLWRLYRPSILGFPL